ncbi:hypothetical protein L5515_016684 [Caenorhabditis briggsae]|uniref:Uncharacterized protein n=1 Tax=Caenorhabditis briggsae TaxID=6238 RepID=A0AAE9JPU0_CAEBR|nr:hypothetical protein L5515_016684 [Caenorhabditis briggsae]
MSSPPEVPNSKKPQMVQAMFPHPIGNSESANSIIRNAFTHFLPDHKPHNSPERHRTIYKHVLEGMIEKGHSPYLSQFAVKKLAEFAEVSPKRITNLFVSGRHGLKNRVKLGFRPLVVRAKRSEADSIVIELLDEGVQLYGCDVEKLWRFGIPDVEKITIDGKEIEPFMKVLIYVFHKLTAIDKNAMIGRSEAVLLAKTLLLSSPEKVIEWYTRRQTAAKRRAMVFDAKMSKDEEENDGHDVEDSAPTSSLPSHEWNAEITEEVELSESQVEPINEEEDGSATGSSGCAFGALPDWEYLAKCGICFN